MNHSAHNPALMKRFTDLAREWHEATMEITAPDVTLAHPACRAIVALGARVIPLILAKLEVDPHFPWMFVLHEMTGAQPVPPESAGNLSAARDAWLSWGRANGYAPQP